MNQFWHLFSRFWQKLELGENPRSRGQIGDKPSARAKCCFWYFQPQYTIIFALIISIKISRWPNTLKNQYKINVLQIYLWVAPRLFLSSSCEAVWHQYGQVAMVAIVMSHYRWLTIAIYDVTYGLIQCGLQQKFPFGLLNSGGDELSHVIRKDWARHKMAIFSKPMSHGQWLTGMSHIYEWLIQGEEKCNRFDWRNLQ